MVFEIERGEEIILFMTTKNYFYIKKNLKYIQLTKNIVLYLLTNKIILRRCENSPCKIENNHGDFRTCQGCFTVAYCCKNCQVNDWKKHIENCKKFCKLK